MTPTRPAVLLALAAGFAVLGYLLAEVAYGSVPVLPLSAPVTLALLAVAEGGMAKVVRDRVQHRRDRDGRPPRRPLHPVQVARAAALAKASSPTGAVVLGVYAGLFAWTAQHRELAAADRDVVVSGLSALAGLGLVVAALLLERACRVPDPPEEDPPLGSTA